MNNFRGKQVAHWRIDRDMTRIDLATLLGVTPGAVRHWESGRRTPPGTVWRIVEIMEMLQATSPNVYQGLIQAAAEKAAREGE